MLHRKKRDGFTLIEVLIALFIAGIAILAVVSLISKNTSSSIKLSETFAASIFSQIDFVKIQFDKKIDECITILNNKLCSKIEYDKENNLDNTKITKQFISKNKKIIFYTTYLNYEDENEKTN